MLNQYFRILALSLSLLLLILPLTACDSPSAPADPAPPIPAPARPDYVMLPHVEQMQYLKENIEALIPLEYRVVDFQGDDPARLSLWFDQCYANGSPHWCIDKTVYKRQAAKIILPGGAIYEIKSGGTTELVHTDITEHAKENETLRTSLRVSNDVLSAQFPERYFLSDSLSFTVNKTGAAILAFVIEAPERGICDVIYFPIYVINAPYPKDPARSKLLE